MAQVPHPRQRSRSPEKPRRITIAEGIRSAVDSQAIASGLSQKLKNAKLLHKMLQKKHKDHLLEQPLSKSPEQHSPHFASERAPSVFPVYLRSDIIEEDLPSKKDLLAQVGLAAAEPSLFDQQVAQATMLTDAQLSANPLRSHHLWSKKALDMFKRLYKYTSNIVPQYEFLRHYSQGDALGVIDTFLAYESSEHIENFNSYWAHFNQRFEINKSEIEPLAMMLARDGVPEQNLALRPNHVAYTILNALLGHTGTAHDHRSTMEEAHYRDHEDEGIRPGVGGDASIVHLRATLVGVLKTPAEALGDGSVDNEAENRSSNPRTHVRPLFTAGDLMLALFELADPKLFKSGSIQLFGRLAMKDATWSPEVNFFRVEYTMLMPNKWSYYRPKHDLYLRDADLLAFISPSTCPKAFEIFPMDASIETTAMKIWVANFVRNFLGFRADDSSVLESAIINVQIVRRIDDGYLYYSQVQHPTKEQLAAHEQRRDDILWREQMAISQCDFAQLVQDGDGYSTHIRVVDVNDVKIAHRESIKNQAVMLSNIKTARLRRRMRATMHVRSVGLQLADQRPPYKTDNSYVENKDHNSDEDRSDDRHIGEMTHEEFLYTYHRYFADQIPRFISRAKTSAVNVNTDSLNAPEDDLSDRSGESALGEDADTFSFGGDDLDGECKHSDIRSNASTEETKSTGVGQRENAEGSVEDSHLDTDASASESASEAVNTDSYQASLTGDGQRGGPGVADTADANTSSSKSTKHKSAVGHKDAVVVADSPKKDLLSKFIPKHGAVRRLSASELNRKKELGVRLKHGNYASEEVGDFLQLCTGNQNFAFDFTVLQMTALFLLIALVKNTKDEEMDDFFKGLQNEDASGSSGDDVKDLGKNKIAVAKTHYARTKYRREYLQQLKAHEEAKQTKMAELRILEEMAAIRKAQREITKNNPAFIITSDLLLGTSDKNPVHANKEASRRVSDQGTKVVDFQAEIAKKIASSRISNATKKDLSKDSKMLQHSSEGKVNFKPFGSAEAPNPFPSFDLLPMAYLKRTLQFNDGKRMKKKRKRKKTVKITEKSSKTSHSVSASDPDFKAEEDHSNHERKHNAAQPKKNKRRSTHKSKKSANVSNNPIQTDEVAHSSPDVPFPNKTDSDNNLSEERARFGRNRHFSSESSECESIIGDSDKKSDKTAQQKVASPSLTSTQNSCVLMESASTTTVESVSSHAAAVMLLGRPAASEAMSYWLERDAKVIRDASRRIAEFVITVSLGQAMAHLTSQPVPVDSLSSHPYLASGTVSERGVFEDRVLNGCVESIYPSTLSTPKSSDYFRSKSTDNSVPGESSLAVHDKDTGSASQLLDAHAEKPFCTHQEVKSDANTIDLAVFVLRKASDTKISSIGTSALRDLPTSLDIRQASHLSGASQEQHISKYDVDDFPKLPMLPTAHQSSASVVFLPADLTAAVPSAPLSEALTTQRREQQAAATGTSMNSLSILLPSIGRVSASPSRTSLVINDSDFSEEDCSEGEFNQSSRAKRPSSTYNSRHSVETSRFEGGKVAAATAKGHHRKSNHKSELKMQSVLLRPGEVAAMWECCTMRVDSPPKSLSDPKPRPPLDPPPSSQISGRLSSLAFNSNQDRKQVGPLTVNKKNASPDKPSAPSDAPKIHSVFPAFKESLASSTIHSHIDENEAVLVAGDSVDDHMMHLDVDYFLRSPEKLEHDAPDEEVPQSQSPKVLPNSRKAAIRDDSSCIISKSSNPLVNKTARLLFAASQSSHCQGRNSSKSPAIGSKPRGPKGHNDACISKRRVTTEPKKLEEKVIDDAKFLVKNKEVLANQTGLERAMRALERQPIEPIKSKDSKYGCIPKRPGRNIIGASTAPLYRVVNLPGPFSTEDRAAPSNDHTSPTKQLDTATMPVSERVSDTQTCVLPATGISLAPESDAFFPGPVGTPDSGEALEDQEPGMPLRTPTAATRVIMRTVVRLHSAPAAAPSETPDTALLVDGEVGDGEIYAT